MGLIKGHYRRVENRVNKLAGSFHLIHSKLERRNRGEPIQLSKLQNISSFGRSFNHRPIHKFHFRYSFEQQDLKTRALDTERCGTDLPA